MRRKTTTLYIEGRLCYRAHYWDDRGYSTKTFASQIEADTWVPRHARQAS